MRPVLILSLFSALAAPLPAQAPEPDEELVIRTDTNVVNVLATVRDKKGVLINSLTQDDFEIYEDGVLQPIGYFARQSDLPLTVGLLVDTSVSQQRLLHEERSAGYQFFDAIIRQEKDLAFLISFDVNIELLQDLTASRPLLRSGLELLQIEGGGRGVTPGPVPQSGKPVGTAMYDSIFLAAEEVLQPQVGRKAVVIIGDGNDYGSRYSEAETIAAALRSDVAIYAVRYFDRDFYFQAGGMGTGGSGALKRLTRDTGGSVHEVSRKKTLAQVLDEINEEIRSQYSIGFTPTKDLSVPGFRKLEVRVKPKGYDVQARQGYYPSALP